MMQSIVYKSRSSLRILVASIRSAEQLAELAAQVSQATPVLEVPLSWLLLGSKIVDPWAKLLDIAPT